MSLTYLPSVAEASALPMVLERRVSDDLIDDNGHMNVRHYLTISAKSSAEALRGIGFDEEYRRASRRGLFTAEHHLTYLGELIEGDRVSTHVRQVGRSRCALHSSVMLVDRSRDRLSYLLEVVLIHVDLESRQATAWPEEMAAGLDAMVAAHAALPWPAPLCGAMGIR